MGNTQTTEVKDVDQVKIKMYISLLGGIILTYAALVLGKNVSKAYLTLLILGMGLAFLAYLYFRRFNQEKLLQKLRAAWAQEQTASKRDLEEISALFNFAPQQLGKIDDRTWRDLNMDLIFAKMDRTFTNPGQQTLYQILRLLKFEADWPLLEKRKKIIRSFQEHAGLREQVQMALSKADRRIGAGLTFLLWVPAEIKPVHPLGLYKFMSVLALLSPLALIFGGKGLVFIVIMFQVNMYLHFSVQKNIRSYFEAVRSLGQLIRVGESLSALRCLEMEETISALRALLEEVAPLLKRIRFVGIESTDPIINSIFQYQSIFFLSEVREFYRVLKFIKKNRDALQQFFLIIGELDALQSVASYRESLRYYCEPEFKNLKQLHSQELYHPLLAKPVSNSIDIQDLGILVTGSNMSGKSTFLRSMGVNALLAQTVVTCHARSYASCPIQLLTCIGRADNVVEGKSYYLEEALGILRVLNSVQEKAVTLAIFDEMFRGTNSEERIIGAYRILEYIVARNALVLVATHDLELTDMLQDSYRNIHFSERVGSLGLEFDYKLKEGPSTTKNAIALLRHLKYPLEITDPV